MKYPNSSKVYVKPNTSAAKRGMSLEEDINTTNRYYLTNDIAVIYKKPTPITIVNVDYPKRSAARITEAYFKVASTTDYNGIYLGKYIDFEAKECTSKTSFPFSSIHPHQIRHLSDVLRHGAIAFIILRMTYYNKDFLIRAQDFIDFYHSGNRRSLPYAWILENGSEIGKTYQKPCDYLETLNRVYEM
ncbi:MAG: Holliday junction resolvase RecU [Erysipelotrichaceae bacterium]|nr:Holliday junction resolvase RecU [Erysipelotrichaceae bacterium]